MMEKTMKRVGSQITNQVFEALEEKTNPKTEWQQFSCDLGHEFAVKVQTDVSVLKLMELYHVLRCPACYSDSIKKQQNL